MKAPHCPTCGTPLEWSRDKRRYLPCHPSPEAAALIRSASRKQRAVREGQHAYYLARRSARAALETPATDD